MRRLLASLEEKRITHPRLHNVSHQIAENMIFNYNYPKSISGRTLTKPPKRTANQKKWDSWLLENAKSEAIETNNSFAFTQIKNIIVPQKGKYFISQSDYSTINLLLFGETDSLIEMDLA